MTYLTVDSRVRVLNDDHVTCTDEIPVGIYKYYWDNKNGSWLLKINFEN